MFQRYGQISPSQLVELENEVKNMTWDPSQPIDIVYEAVETLASASYRAGVQHSTAQKNNMAYLIINRTGAFTTGIRNWLKVHLNLRTWENFKEHFRREQGLLEIVTAGTIQDSRVQQANLVQQVVEGIQNMFFQPEPELALA